MSRNTIYSQDKEKSTGMNTLTMVLNKAVLNGYTEQFKVGSRGFHGVGRGSKVYQPEEICICNFYRFEGESDPGDNAILYVVETSDGRKGTLVDAYGLYADVQISEFMHQVEDIQKKTNNVETNTGIGL
ncbi:MAG: hypothetical protein ABI378_04710 [Chitinophagaceae bacterium]